MTHPTEAHIPLAVTNPLLMWVFRAVIVFTLGLTISLAGQVRQTEIRLNEVYARQTQGLQTLDEVLATERDILARLPARDEADDGVN